MTLLIHRRFSWIAESLVETDPLTYHWPDTIGGFEDR